MKNVYKISFIKLVLGLIALNCYGQSYLITNEKQIKPSVKNDIVNTSSDFQDMKTKVNLLNSATTQLRNDLNTEISTRQAITNSLTQDIATLYSNTSTSTLANTFVLKSGDNITGNLQVGGNIDITGQYLINGQPFQAGDNLGNHIATTTLNLNDNDIVNPVFIKRPYGEIPIALIVGDLQNEYYDSISTGSYIGITRDFLELSSKITDNNANPYSYFSLSIDGNFSLFGTYNGDIQANYLTLRTNNIEINTFNGDKSILLTQNSDDTTLEIQDGTPFSPIILHGEYDNIADEHTGTIIINRKTETQPTKSLTLNTSMLQSQETDFMLQASELTFDANSYTYNANNIYGNGQNIEFSNFNNITFRNNTYIGDGSTAFQVYICSSGTLNGMLTITDTECTSAGGTAEGTKLFIKK